MDIYRNSTLFRQQISTFFLNHKKVLNWIIQHFLISRFNISWRIYLQETTNKRQIQTYANIFKHINASYLKIVLFLSQTSLLVHIQHLCLWWPIQFPRGAWPQLESERSPFPWLPWDIDTRPPPPFPPLRPRRSWSNQWWTHQTRPKTSGFFCEDWLWTVAHRLTVKEKRCWLVTYLRQNRCWFVRRRTRKGAGLQKKYCSVT